MEPRRRLTREGWQRIEKVLGQTTDVAAGPCVDEALLVSYAFGFAGEEDRATIERHLHDCALCLEEIGALMDASEHWERHPERIEELRKLELMAQTHDPSTESVASEVEMPAEEKKRR